jgi:hypothetical protein
MMRRTSTTLPLLVACISLVAVASAALAPTAPAAARASAAGAPSQSAKRTWRLTLSAAPDDLSRAQGSFHARGRQPLSERSLAVAVEGAFGDDYLAVATPRLAAPGVERALVLLVNRPSPLLDPVYVHVSLVARGALGTPVVRKLANSFARAPSAPRPALCDLGLHGDAALEASALAPLGSRGTPLSGFGAAAAVAQAYDVSCSLSYSSEFASAVGHATSEAPGSPEAPESPSPPTPVPSPPHCTPCNPQPGYACPLALGPNICVADARQARASAS